jgi:putative endonuclease
MTKRRGRRIDLSELVQNPSPHIRYTHLMEKSGYVYIMANSRPTLYVGVTSNIIQRVYQHKHDMIDGFTKTYQLHTLVYFEVFDTIQDAIIREKQLKDMNRKEKLTLIEGMNPQWKDLYSEILEIEDSRAK